MTEVTEYCMCCGRETIMCNGVRFCKMDNGSFWPSNVSPLDTRIPHATDLLKKNLLFKVYIRAAQLIKDVETRYPDIAAGRMKYRCPFMEALNEAVKEYDDLDRTYYGSSDR